MRNIVALALVWGAGILSACSSKTPATNAPPIGSSSAASTTGGQGGLGSTTGTASTSQSGTGGLGSGGMGGGGSGGSGLGGAGMGGGGPGTTSTSSASSSSASSSSGAGGSIGPAGCDEMTVNNCTKATAEDHTADPLVTVNFGVDSPGPDAYSPNCIKIKVGASVKFSGDMGMYPIEAGPNCTADTCGGANPISDGGPTKFLSAGTFPYHSTTACTMGMLGVVFVVP